jgi:hypothetical protein
MATYAELNALQNNDTLIEQVRVACVIAAETIRGESEATDNHANRMVWAASVFANPRVEGTRMLWAVLAANKDMTVPQITGATDAQVQAAVDAAVDLFATGG